MFTCLTFEIFVSRKKNLNFNLINCDLLPIEINSKMKFNFMKLMFSFPKLLPNSLKQ